VIPAGKGSRGAQQVMRDHRGCQPGAVRCEKPGRYLELIVGCPPRA